MMKLMKISLISAMLATSGFAATSYLEPGQTITLSQAEAGQLQIQAGDTLEMQGTSNSTAKISMGTGTTLTVSGNITTAAGAEGVIESTATAGSTKPIIDIVTYADAGTIVKSTTTGLDSTYQNIIGTDTGEWTVYEVGRGYIDSAVTYSPSQSSFDITYSGMVLAGVDREENTNIIYDLDKNGINAKVIVDADGAITNFGQSFCTTGSGYPELTLNVMPNGNANLGYMTNGKVIIKYNDTIVTSLTKWPKCDVDFAVNGATSNVTGDGMEVPANKTWAIRGSAGVSIGTNITVKGTLIL